MQRELRRAAREKTRLTLLYARFTCPDPATARGGSARQSSFITAVLVLGPSRRNPFLTAAATACGSSCVPAHPKTWFNHSRQGGRGACPRPHQCSWICGRTGTPRAIYLLWPVEESSFGEPEDKMASSDRGRGQNGVCTTATLFLCVVRSMESSSSPSRLRD